MKSHYAMSCRTWQIIGILGILMNLAGASASAPGIFQVRDYGAKGDGQTLDTSAVNQAIEACVKAGGGRVVLTPGRYLCGTVHLKSHVALYLEAGARLIGTPDLDQYQQATPPKTMPEASWGKWHRALILADQTIRRWVWLTPKQEKEILFPGLILPMEGPCVVRAGSCKLDLKVTSP